MSRLIPDFRLDILVGMEVLGEVFGRLGHENSPPELEMRAAGSSVTSRAGIMEQQLGKHRPEN
ncbi:hypothetical protein AA0535_1213 [Asaia krungthepensis NRIC 0535]|uniref:Uncharacterized protein n=1 Tax=Asaia krungthepensis NRIC 0535 TaxID=1307925 RepID=A0ABQ0Q1R4_9PROT|nr:hypothetical protein AA0535_1213 [Asaia krungthepensis NRIC 0535]